VVKQKEHKLWPQQFKIKKEPLLVVSYNQLKFQRKQAVVEVKMVRRKKKVELNLFTQEKQGNLKSLKNQQKMHKQ
jgi:hypothetical protein